MNTSIAPEFSGAPLTPPALLPQAVPGLLPVPVDQLPVLELCVHALLYQASFAQHNPVGLTHFILRVSGLFLLCF